MQVLKNHHLNESVPNLPIIVITPNFPYFSIFWFYLRPFACTHLVNCYIFYRESMTTPVACFVWNRKSWESSAPINWKPFSFTFYNVTRKKHLKLDILSLIKQIKFDYFNPSPQKNMHGKQNLSFARQNFKNYNLKRR